MQVMINLISNAIKFSQIGGFLYVKVEKKLLQDQFYEISIQVSDQGIGIT
jgi:signal transduction histidine kinase